MERSTKEELRTHLELIKECYPICDIESFAHHVVSRLSKIIERRVHEYKGKSLKITDFVTGRHFQRVSLHDKFFKPLSVENQISRTSTSTSHFDLCEL